MNILNITSSFPLYDGHGAGPFILEEALEISRSGYNQIVLTQSYNGASEHEFIGPLEVYRFRWIKPKRYTRIREMSYLPHLPHLISYFVAATIDGLRIIKQRQIDIIYAQWSLPSGLIGYILSKLTKAPLVVSVYGADILGNRPVKFPFKNLNRTIFQNADKILVRVDHLYERIINIYSEKFTDKLVNIPVGLDIEKFIGGIEDTPPADIKKAMGCNGRPVVLTIRNLSPNYQLENLLTAIKMFFDISGSIKPLFIIIGGGTPPYTAKLRELVNRLGINEYVLFLGPVEHKKMSAYIAACDIFVDPAIIGQGVACLEAMSLAKPTVGFYGRGAAVKIINGKTGFLIKITSPMDKACRKMAEKIKVLLEDEVIRKELGEAALPLVRQNYNWREITTKISSILEEVTNKRTQ